MHLTISDIPVSAQSFSGRDEVSKYLTTRREPTPQKRLSVRDRLNVGRAMPVIQCMRMVCLATATLLGLLAYGAVCQSRAPAFEVASVKQNKSGNSSSSSGFTRRPDGGYVGFAATNNSLRLHQVGVWSESVSDLRTGLARLGPVRRSCKGVVRCVRKSNRANASGAFGGEVQS